MSRINYVPSSGYPDSRGVWHYPSIYNESAQPPAAQPYGNLPYISTNPGFSSQQIATVEGNSHGVLYSQSVPSFSDLGQTHPAYGQNMNQNGVGYGAVPSNVSHIGPAFISGNVQDRQGEPPSKRMRPNYIPPVVTKYEVPEHIKKRHLEQVSQRTELSRPLNHDQNPPTWQYGQTPQLPSRPGYPHELPTPSTAGSPVFHQPTWDQNQLNQYGTHGFASSAGSPYTPQPSPYDTASTRYLPPSQTTISNQTQRYPVQPPVHYGAYEMTPAKSISPAMRSSFSHGGTQYPHEENFSARVSYGSSIVPEHIENTQDIVRAPVRTVIVPNENLPPMSPVKSRDTRRHVPSASHMDGEYDPMNPSAGLEDGNMRGFRNNRTRESATHQIGEHPPARLDRHSTQDNISNKKSKKKKNKKRGGHMQDLSKPSQPGKVNKKRSRPTRHRGQKRRQAEATLQEAKSPRHVGPS